MLSTFGVMFARDQERAAAEFVRACRPGGRIGLANWTPSGFIGQMSRRSDGTCRRRLGFGPWESGRVMLRSVLAPA